jgi:hypothetical protein
MKKYIITSQKFTGQVELIYNGNGTLAKIDFTPGELDHHQVHYLVKHIPANEVDMSTSFQNLPITIVSEDYRITFDDFWNYYDQKHNRKRAEALWKKLSKTDQVIAYNGLKAYTKHLNANAWKNKADPDTYLRNRMWENNYK